MIFYHDLQIWEVEEGSGRPLRTDLTRGAASGAGSSLGLTVSWLGDVNMQVVEVANRIAGIAKVCTYLRMMACVI